MGYYIQISKSDAFIPADRLEECYHKMCTLNETHDHEKRGGSWSDGKQNTKWFSWMDANYPQTCKDAQAIFEQMGFETEYNQKGDLLITGYDSKMGQEDIFLKAIEHDAVGSIKWHGEDGEEWTTQFFGGNVIDVQPVPKNIGMKK